MAELFARRSIRIGGKIENSPRFFGKDRKRRADEWYSAKTREKDFLERGILSSSVPTFMQFAAKWIRRRMEEYPKSTWYSDEQRLRDYLLPNLSEFPMDKITRNQMHTVLKKVQQENKLSVSTRTKIKMLASKIFNDAMNEHPPLCTANPCAKLTFSDPRKGSKTPAVLDDDREAILFLKMAKEIGELELLIVTFILMTGLRKSEAIPRIWRNVKSNADRSYIRIDSHVEQVSLSIKPGTKAGSEESRDVYVAPKLIEILNAYREKTPFHRESDFIFANSKGDWIRPRVFHEILKGLFDRFEKEHGKRITLHKLRHTYGGIFTAKTGNSRALQQQLGHKSPATTAIYSTLSGSQVKTFAEQIVFERVNPNQSETTPKRHHNEPQPEDNQHVSSSTRRS